MDEGASRESDDNALISLGVAVDINEVKPMLDVAAEMLWAFSLDDDINISEKILEGIIRTAELDSTVEKLASVGDGVPYLDCESSCGIEFV